MKKIGIFGSFGSSSIGDEAILKGIINILLELDKKQNYKLIIYTANSEITSKAITIDYENLELREFNSTKNNRKNSQPNKKIKENKKNIYRLLYKTPSISLFFEEYLRKIFRKSIINAPADDLDLLIFAGGNIFMDKFVRWPLMMESMINKVECPVCFIGVGAGPINNFYTKVKFKEYLSKYYISTRDQESLELIKSLGSRIKNLKLGNDLAFGLECWNYKPNSSHKYFGVSLIPYNHPSYWPKADINKYNNYIQNMANLILSINKTTSLVPLFLSTNYPSDTNPAYEVVEKIKIGEIITERQNVEEILKSLTDTKFLLGTRLHSIILSSIASIPTVGVGYQPKVKNFMNRFDLLSNFIDIKTLEKEVLDIETIEKILDNVKLDKNIDSLLVKKTLTKEINQILNEALY